MKIKLLIIITGLAFGYLRGQAYNLEECISIALQNKESLKASALDVESARVGTYGSSSGILPSIRFNGSWNETRFPPQQGAYNPGTGDIEREIVSSLTSWSSGLNVSQTIYDGGVWWNTIAESKNNYQLAGQVNRQVQINIIYEVHRSFFSFLKSQQLLDVAELNLTSSRQQMELVKYQYELGAVKKTDLLKAEVNIGLARVDVINQETFLKNAYRDLKNAMGLMGSGLEFGAADAGRPMEPIPDYNFALETMENQNPSLLTKRHQIAGAELTRKLAQGARLPSISVNISYSGNAIDSESLINKWNDNWRMNTGLTLSFPLYSGNSLSTRHQRAQLSHTKQQSEYQTQKQDLMVKLNGLLDVLDNYVEIIPINEQILTSAEEDLKLAQERYALGANTILEVLDAQVSVIRAQSSVITTKYDARIQQANLKALLGTLDSDLQ